MQSARVPFVLVPVSLSPSLRLGPDVRLALQTDGHALCHGGAEPRGARDGEGGRVVHPQGHPGGVTPDQGAVLAAEVLARRGPETKYNFSLSPAFFSAGNRGLHAT